MLTFNDVEGLIFARDKSQAVLETIQLKGILQDECEWLRFYLYGWHEWIVNSRKNETQLILIANRSRWMALNSFKDSHTFRLACLYYRQM